MAADTVARFHAGLIDSEGIKSTALTHLFIDSGQTVAALKTALTNWADALDLITGAQILNISAYISAAVPGGVKGAPVAGSEVQEVAVFDFNQTGLPWHAPVTVPAFLEADISGGQVNEAQTDVAAWITLLTSAVLGGTYTGMSNAALASLYRTFLSDRKRRRAKFAKSVRVP